MEENRLVINEEISEVRAKFVQRKTEYYLPRFEQSNEERRADWNWCAFFVTPLWCAYRKMYGLAAVCWIVMAIIGFVVALFGEGLIFDLIDLAATLAFSGVIATKANTLYKKRIDSLIGRMPDTEAEKDVYIKKKGGVNKPVVVILIVIAALSEIVTIMASFT